MVRIQAGSKAIENGMAAAILDSLCDGMVALWYGDGSKKMLTHPDNSVASLVISEDIAPPHMGDKVVARRARYGMVASGH